jgi:glycosyltransferase involved in cell wall biosynthesis
MTPKVSVVMPVYNGERFVRKAIDSILNQTFEDFEFVIVDDASKDGSWAILTAYAEQDARIKLVQNAKNLGEAGARNAGLAVAAGEYIAVQDADDVSLPHRFEEQVAYLDAHPEAVALASPAQRIDLNDQPLSMWKVPRDSKTVHALLLLNSPLCHTTMMARGSAIRAIDGYRAVFTTDYDIWWRLSQVGEIHTLPEPVAHYRADERDTARITVGQSDKQLYGAQEISLEIASQMIGDALDVEAYKRFFLASRGVENSLQKGDIARLQPLWERLAADPDYRRAIGPKLVSCALKNTSSSPSEAMQLLRIAEREFDIPWGRIARRYARYYIFDPLNRLNMPKMTALLMGQ